jgi:hypothetical protein
MQPAIDRNTLEGLIALGRQRGGLTNLDLQAALPIGTMSAEDIALIVIQLEEAGVPVELDESLLQPREGAAPPRPLPGAEILPFPKRPATLPKPRPRADSSVSRLGGAAAPAQVTRPMRPVHWAVAGSVLLVLLIAIVFLTLGH